MCLWAYALHLASATEKVNLAMLGAGTQLSRVVFTCEVRASSGWDGARTLHKAGQAVLDTP